MEDEHPEAEGEEEEHPEAEGEEDEYHEAEGSTTAQEFWLRGPANLPRRPTREEEKTVIIPIGDT